MALYASRFTISDRFGGLYTTWAYIRPGLIHGRLQYIGIKRSKIHFLPLKENLPQKAEETRWTSDEIPFHNYICITTHHAKRFLVTPWGYKRGITYLLCLHWAILSWAGLCGALSLPELQICFCRFAC